MCCCKFVSTCIPSQQSSPLPLFLEKGRFRVLNNASSSKRRSSIRSSKNASPNDDYHSTLRALKSRGRFPTKSLGQHYMLNADINDLLVQEAEVKKGDIVLEIGTGTGSLTNALVNAGAFVLGIDKDAHMVALTSQRFENNDKVKVIQEDVTTCRIKDQLKSFSDLVAPSSNAIDKARVVSNLPFNISTSVLKILLPMGDIFSEVVLLLQDEMALRLVDSLPGMPEYRLINIFVNFYSVPIYKYRVERTNFFPQPTVDAAIVAFKLKDDAEYPSVASPKNFFGMVSSAFNGKRKMLRKSIQHLFVSSDIEEALKTIGLPETARAGELKMEDFVKLYNLLAE
eukprot:TRINITY_DN4382_c0_g1_i1.p1 TRINITY_DN4382_c0_g1~~TRINITY_DN4382_c0_g1_i1.p1  ORF type:complete len:341 (+),score=75.97 TRINITY_DN4382_c0_g1_i1:94-1116(+)